MRTDKGLGTKGTMITSAARRTFSDSNEMPGAQSRNNVVYFSRKDLLILSSRSVGRLRALKCTSKCRYEKSAGIRSKPG